MRRTIVVLAVSLTLAVGVLGAAVFRLEGISKPHLETPYQAILLDNGQVYYGKVSGLQSNYPKVTDVFYVVRATDPNTKQTKNVLVRRGKEWHAPMETYLNAQHIIMVEPVNPSSDVAKLIAQSGTQTP